MSHNETMNYKDKIEIVDMSINDFLIYAACPTTECNYKKLVTLNIPDLNKKWKCEKCGNCISIDGKFIILLLVLLIILCKLYFLIV